MIGAVPPIMVKTEANPGGLPIEVPTPVMHGDDDQIVPIENSAMLSMKLLTGGTLKVYEGLQHGMCTTHADVINADLLDFVRG
jgi:non-heme chloroperoxidase